MQVLPLLLMAEIKPFKSDPRDKTIKQQLITDSEKRYLSNESTTQLLTTCGSYSLPL